MTRDYIKLDPALPERKDYYPDGPFRALIKVLCYATHQPIPGTFKNDKLLRVLLEGHAKFVPFLVDERDIIRHKDGSLEVPGWVEWQTGAYPTVSARMEAIEKRRRSLSPADRAFLYRQRQKERDGGRRDGSRDGPRDASRDAESELDPTVTKPDSGVRPPSRLVKREDGSFGLAKDSAA